ncbi:MAG: GDSL-type esterase/lipase family protein [Paludibacteraceae bacterium]|nr:GDSL-type esterase/lipase family protein [Paludibacteraceae bacterium]
MKPRHIAYIIWTIIALLGAVSWIVPNNGFSIGKWTLRWPTLAEALDIRGTVDSVQLSVDTLLLAEADSIIFESEDTLGKKDTITPPPIIPIVDVANIDTRAYLAAFYAALDSTNSMPVRVVHYGDSQTEEDRITNVLREHWQKQYGGGGVGLIPLHQTIPTRTIRQWLSINNVVQTAQGGPKRYLVYGPRSMRLNNDDYGVMGQVAVMDSTLVAGSEDIVMNIEPIDKKYKSHNYFNRVRILTDSVSSYVMTRDTILHSATQSYITPLYTLPDSTTKCEIHLQGKGKVYGISLETPTGVIVDNIPMRGCSGNIFTKIDSASLSVFYRETNTRLIILQFGGNMIPQTENPSTISGYVRSTLRQQVRYLRACAPESAILFIGPSDMSTRIDGEMATYPLVPYMDKLLKKMAEEEQIAYWSMYDAMGGKNSMVKWVEIGLAGSDYVHFTRAGANKVGRLLYDWLMAYPNSLNTKH